MNNEYMEMLRKNIPQLDMALHINKSNIELLARYDFFIDYIKENNINLYNKACEYADKQ